MEDIQAFIFDVFGTVVDWRTTIVEELRVQGNRCGASSINQPKASPESFVDHTVDLDKIDWNEFAGDWRTAFWVAT